MRKRVLLLTGAPGVGKTTVLIKAVQALKASGVSVGGMVSREVREIDGRVGFEIIDLANGRHGWLAHINQKSGPQVGRYRVNLKDLDSVGTAAIDEATKNCQVVAIDEIGPMELYSEKFKQTVEQAMEGKNLVLAVVHLKAKDPLITWAKQRDDSETYTVTLANRDEITEHIKQKTAALLEHII